MSTPNPLVADALQQTLVDLIALELQAKQAHWNIRGARFRSLHLALDEVVETARNNYDSVAERLAAIGGSPDGRAQSVYQTTILDEMDSGLLEVDKTYQLMAEKVQKVSDKVKESIGPVDEICHISGDLLIGIGSALDFQAWLLRSATE